MVEDPSFACFSCSSRARCGSCQPILSSLAASGILVVQPSKAFYFPRFFLGLQLLTTTCRNPVNWTPMSPFLRMICVINCMLLKVSLTVKILARRDEEVAFTASKKEEIIFQHSQIMNQRLID